jgi:hypothetical protein
MLLADRGFANHQLMAWLWRSHWHYCLRLPCDVMIHGTQRYPRTVAQLYPPVREAKFYRNVGLWQDGSCRCHLVLATVKGAKDSWAVVTDEAPSLQTLWQYSLRFCVEFIYREAKQFTGLCDAQTRDAQRLDFYFNASLTALNLARYEAYSGHSQMDETAQPISFSMSSYKRLAFNDHLLLRFISMLDLDSTLIKSHPNYEKLRSYGIVGS